MTTETIAVSLDRLTIDPNMQARVRLDEATEREYADRLLANLDLPPIEAVRDPDNRLWVWDGFHRVSAHHLANRDLIAVVVRQGTRADALWLATAANQAHGLKRSNADKRRAVEMALKAKPSMSDGAIAEHVGVTQPFVSKVRSEVITVMTPINGKPETRTGKDGRQHKVPAKPKAPPKAKPVEEAPPPEPATEPEKPKAPPKVVPPPQVDAWGIPIQPHAAAAFADVPKFKELLNTLRLAQRQFDELANSPGGRFLTLPEVSSCRKGVKQDDGTFADRFVHTGLERAVEQVRLYQPTHTVCPYQYADAPHPDPCPTCHNLCWTTKLGGSIPEVCVNRAKEAHGV